jgi:hypothetical protein
MQDATPWDKPADGLPQFLQDRDAKGAG